MFKLFKAVQQNIAAQRLFKTALELNAQGDKTNALKLCENLVNQYPYDIQFRHRLALLQQELGQDIKLPNIQPNTTPRQN